MNDSGSRLIFGLMAAAVGFSLIGNEVKVAQSNQGTAGQVGAGVTVAGRIIIGGFFATAILVLVSHAGDPGEKIGTGIATIAVLGSALVYGKPVWDAANNLFGSKPTNPLGTSPTAAAVASDTALATGLTPRTAATGITL